MMEKIREKKELTCIGCPLGCFLCVVLENGIPVQVTGNTCRNGEKYACREVTAPERIVTTTVRVTGGIRAVVPVKTRTGIPKGKIFDCIKVLRACTVTAPVSEGDIILSDVAKTGVAVIATGEVALK